VHRAHFEPWALGGDDKHGEHENPKWWTLDSLMELNGACSYPPTCSHRETELFGSPLIGHTFIDILKIDIEGGEFEALTPFFASHVEGDLPIGQLQIEIHAWRGRERFEQFLKWWESLEAAGLRPFWMEPNLVYLNIYRGSEPSLQEVRLFSMSSRDCVVC
jgi:hypothetical protein